MYTVTAICDGGEIGYGEGESDHYAVEECIESIPAIFKECSGSHIQLIVRKESGNISYVTSWYKYLVETSAN